MLAIVRASISFYIGQIKYKHVYIYHNRIAVFAVRPRGICGLPR
jgi:hypothetical protein